MNEIIFQIISLGGTAKSLAYEALEAAESGDFDQAKVYLAEADQYLKASHQVQAELIQAETEGKGASVSLLMVHAQDHLMTAMEAKSLIEAMIRMLERFENCV